jgi:hypothetical protein
LNILYMNWIMDESISQARLNKFWWKNLQSGGNMRASKVLGADIY